MSICLLYKLWLCYFIFKVNHQHVILESICVHKPFKNKWFLSYYHLHAKANCQQWNFSLKCFFTQISCTYSLFYFILTQNNHSWLIHLVSQDKRQLEHGVFDINIMQRKEKEADRRRSTRDGQEGKNWAGGWCDVGMWAEDLCAARPPPTSNHTEGADGAAALRSSGEIRWHQTAEVTTTEDGWSSSPVSKLKQQSEISNRRHIR